MTRLPVILFAMSAATAPVPLLAQTQTPAAAPAPAQMAADDPVICEKQEQLGSRIAAKRICMKRAEWQERRLQDRGTLEKTQTQRGMYQNGG